MKVLIDTNVVLDVLCNRQEFLEASEKVFKLCEVNKISGYLSALSIPNILYVMRKELEPERTKEILDKLMLIFHIADLEAEDLKRAAELKFKDYEDAVQSVCASRIHADYIVTRNIRDFTASKVTAIKPSELLERL